MIGLLGLPVFGPAFFAGCGYEQPFVVHFPILRLVLGLCVWMSPFRTVAMIILQNVARFARFDGFSLLMTIAIFSVLWDMGD